MTEEARDILTRDLDKIAKKHGLTNCAFCGTTAEDEFYGAAVGDKVSQADVFNIAMNVGRLWQHFRGLTRDVLNTFERKVW
jgi:hypothetical protein